MFISSVQDEFATERKQLKKWLTTDPFVSRFVEKVFLFEDVPSRGKPPEGLTIEKLFKSHTSFPVNDLVLKTFDFAGLIE